MAHLLCIICMEPVDNALEHCDLFTGDHSWIFHWCCWFGYEGGDAAIGREDCMPELGQRYSTASWNRWVEPYYSLPLVWADALHVSWYTLWADTASSWADVSYVHLNSVCRSRKNKKNITTWVWNNKANFICCGYFDCCVLLYTWASGYMYLYAYIHRFLYVCFSADKHIYIYVYMYVSYL